MPHAIRAFLLTLLLVSPLLADPPRHARILRGHDRSIAAVTFRPDGKHLASGDYDCRVRLWDVESARCVLAFDADLEEFSCGLDSLGYSPDGRALAVAYGYGVPMMAIWNTDDGTLVRELKAEEAGKDVEISHCLECVRWSPDGTRLAAVARNRDTGLAGICLWSASTGKLVSTLPRPEGSELPVSVAWHPDGKILAVGGERSIALWSVAEKKIVSSFEAHESSIRSLSYSPDASFLASGEGFGTTRLWESKQGKFVAKKLEGQPVPFECIPLQYLPAVESATFSPDEKILASATRRGLIRLWSVADGKELAVLKGHSGAVNSVAFSPDGRILASAGSDKTIRLWDMTNVDQPESGEK